MNKKISLGSALILTSAAVLLTFMVTFVHIGRNFNRMMADTDLQHRIMLKLSELDGIARNLFIGEIDDQKLLESIADGFVRGLGDRFAEFMPAARYLEHLRLTQGRMVGIGVEVIFSDYRGGVIEVTHVSEESPAEAGGMLVGDYIYKVEGERVADLGYFESISKVRGAVGTDVLLTVLRKPEGAYTREEKELIFTRAEVRVQTVRHELMRGDVGYIRIREFNQETPNEFKAAVDELLGLGAAGFIFDVRNNGGGDLQGITQTLDFLLPPGPIIRIYSGASGENVIHSHGGSRLTAPMVVLMNERTASAAELFCAALKDYEKATLVGVTTFGKGTVQSIHRLSDNSAVKLSTAIYSPPFSDNYDGIGVTPHIEVRLSEEANRTPIERLAPEEDLQLLEALRILERN